MKNSPHIIIGDPPVEVRPEPETSVPLNAFETIVILASIVVIVAGINLAQSVVVPFVVSVFIAMLATGPLRWLKRHRVPSGIGVSLIVIGILIVFAVFIFLIVMSVRNITDAMPVYQARFDEEITQAKNYLAGHGVRSTDQIFQRLITPEAAAGFIVGFLSSLVSTFSNIVLITLTIIFILLEESSFPDKVRSALGDARARFPHFPKFVNDLRRVVVIQTLISFSTGVIMGLWLTILGLDFTILLGLVTFLFNFVPNIGSVIAAVPAVAIAFLQFGVGRAILAALGFFVTGSIVGNFLSPRLMGQHLGLSNLVVFLSVIVWGSLLGIIGMMLCVPFTLAVKFALESSDQTKWIAILLERSPHAAKLTAAPREP
jgi:AI-2 transport protein TqsA